MFGLLSPKTVHRRWLFLLSVAIVLLSSSSCKTQYGIANIHGPSRFLAKPNYVDTTSQVMRGTYINGSFSDNFESSAYDSLENVKQFSFGIHHSKIEKQFDLGYGLFGHFGDYTVNPDRLFPGKKSYWGLGGVFQANIRLGREFKTIAIGPSLGIMYEGGEYADFRNRSDGVEPDFININPDPVTFHTGMQATINLMVEDFNFGARVYLGTISSRISRSSVMRGTLFAAYGRFFFKAESAAILVFNDPDTYALGSFGLAYQIW